MAENEQNLANYKFRPPVVVVLGHVDHGKTKLLDAIRKTHICEKESGGITQHIGAYQVDVDGKLITFLDTPGHEAFTAIRSRGVKVADIAVLVVAADESVKPQTKEAIKIIKEEEIPFIVAINKIDKEGVNSQRVKQDLTSEEVLVEDFGGKTPVVEVSAKNNTNIDGLLEMILLVAELEDLKMDLSSPAEGVIIESNLDKTRGYVATALVKKGIIRLADWIVAGTVVSKIKSMEDFFGRPIAEAGPSQPVVIVGWFSAPQIGKNFVTTSTKDEAKKISADNVDLKPLLLFLKKSGDDVPAPDKKLFNLVFKSDVSSSLEAVENALKAIKSDEVVASVVAYDIGNISEADVKTAAATSAQIIGFRVGVEGSAKNLATKGNIKIATFDVIYDLIEYIRGEMASVLEPEIRKIDFGKLKVLAVFKKDSKWQIIGGKVVSGKAVRGAMANVSRAGIAIAVGKIGQLQQNKIDVEEVKEGLEAGIKLDSIGQQFDEVKDGDIVEIYEEEKIARSL